ncbi:DUF4173 domain-containing protein [Nitrospirillum sp. BR 11828]|uniref:DUF4153 domain-containing protein n=1 Tax=Nitrospirillum sp. BR 11828 TaxID=3104325 RepID=UPI002ACA6262|nr:DUF4173 domain-containing protein [Nitrospirillum sp. BR 11828]MDZ5650524.1 DUF4173 domain-containing protein [Nitrospirillum sp. BR 11828]
MTDTIPVTTAGAMPGGDAPALPAGIAVAGLATLATLLFYDAPLGVDLAAFLALLCAGSLLLNPPAAGAGRWVPAAAGLTAVLALLTEAVTPLSLLLFPPTVAACLLHLTGRWPASAGDRARSVGAMLVQGPPRLWRDGLAALEWGVSGARRPDFVTLAARWVLPLGLGLVFCLLLTTANPILDSWASRLPLDFLSGIDAGRVVFWMVALALLWPFIRIASPGVAMARVDAPASSRWRDHPVAALLLSPAALVRALILFNALFAMQSALDAYYLWTGHPLPPGVTHAAYAHQGAYPLVLTALLAALFVLAALDRPMVSPTVRHLIVAWVAQNIVLVLSAMLRLAGYVHAYSLTVLRLAAFLWMALVAVGLVLILVRMALGRSNRWLVGANLAAAVILLYGAAWMNIPDTIAHFNLMYSPLVWGGRDVDWAYLVRLGPQTIPTMDTYLALHGPDQAVQAARTELAQSFLSHRTDWRSWTLRDQRLKDYLAAHPDGIDHKGQP